MTVQVARGRQTRRGSEHEGLGRSWSPSPQVAGLGWQMREGAGRATLEDAHVTAGEEEERARGEA